MTWLDAFRRWPQGHRGIYAVRFAARGGLLDKLPWGLGLLVSLGLISTKGFTDGVIFVRTVRLLTPVGFIVANDAPVELGATGLYTVAKRIGPAGERANFDDAIEEGLAQ